MNQLHLFHRSYLEQLRKKLWQKRFKNLKTLMTEGKIAQQHKQSELVKNIVSALKKSHEFKIECLLDMAKTMLNDHLEKKPAAIISMVKKLLKNVAEHTDVEISAHPSDAKVIKSYLHELNSSTARQMLIIDDMSLQTGSFIIKANKSIIDAHITTQIARAKELLYL